MQANMEIFMKILLTYDILNSSTLVVVNSN